MRSNRKRMAALIDGTPARAALACGALAIVLAAVAPAHGQEPRVFPTPEDAVRALTEAAKASNLDGLLAIFGADGKDLISSSDPATARQNREVFVVAIAEGWRLVDRGEAKELVIGNEAWPFPVPLVKTAAGWKFDTAAGKEEVLARRIGRNELAAMRISQTYVTAQRLYARRAHDGKPAGLYARRFASDPGTQNGLYWPVKRGEPHSPLGPLVAEAAAEGRQVGTSGSRVPFHGYYFRILEGQGPAAQGGAREYIANGDMSGGFALVAWPAQYDATGIMTFMVNQDGVVFEKDLGPDTAAAVAKITRFDPDTTWQRADAAAAGSR
jgi:Protein of unknown function (DUF2950)